MSGRKKSIGQLRALLSAVVIVLYFALTTVWIPSALLKSSLLTGTGRNTADLVALAVWGAGLGFGIWGLRKAQDRDLI
ncbi:MAG: hypothetical protein U9N56_07920 [Actinomycetota bacterium]|nr:hypothetical protein [Actinomycetota bacterium]